MHLPDTFHFPWSPDSVGRAESVDRTCCIDRRTQTAPPLDKDGAAGSDADSRYSSISADSANRSPGQ